MWAVDVTSAKWNTDTVNPDVEPSPSLKKGWWNYWSSLEIKNILGVQTMKEAGEGEDPKDMVEHREHLKKIIYFL